MALETEGLDAEDAVVAPDPPERPRRAVPVNLGRADLHVHTHYSDGRQSPEDVVRAAAGRVDVLAITDHDVIDGALAARAFARAHPDLGVARTHAHLNWSWTLERLPQHALLKCESFVRFTTRRRFACAARRTSRR